MAISRESSEITGRQFRTIVCGSFKKYLSSAGRRRGGGTAGRSVGQQRETAKDRHRQTQLDEWRQHQTNGWLAKYPTHDHKSLSRSRPYATYSKLIRKTNAFQEPIISWHGMKSHKCILKAPSIHHDETITNIEFERNQNCRRPETNRCSLLPSFVFRHCMENGGRISPSK